MNQPVKERFGVTRSARHPVFCDLPVWHFPVPQSVTSVMSLTDQQ